MKNYILVHGGWHGKWVFDKIVPSLAKNSNTSVIALDLPGHFTNFDKYDFRDVNLKLYVDFVSNFIKTNKLHNSYLVGHSMAGIVISQVGQNIPEYIDKLVYLSAFIPSDNGSLVDEEKKAKFPSVALNIKIDEKNCSIIIDKTKIKELFYHNCKENDINLALSHIQDQPLLPFVDKVSLGDNFNKLHKVYIECLQDQAIHIEDQRRMNSICDKIVSIDTDHSSFFSSCDELVEILGNEHSQNDIV